MTKLESTFVRDDLKPRLNREFPGCMTFKMDPNQLQGVQDLLVLFEDKWALLETKRGRRAAKQPNQEYYVEKMNEMSYSAFVNPDNMEEVILELKRVFRRG